MENYNKAKLKAWFEKETGENFEELSEKEIAIDIYPAYLSWIKADKEIKEYEKNNPEEDE